MIGTRECHCKTRKLLKRGNGEHSPGEKLVGEGKGGRVFEGQRVKGEDAGDSKRSIALTRVSTSFWWRGDSCRGTEEKAKYL